MEASTTIKKMFAGNKIYVPTYQRAYSWDTELDKSKTPKQVNVFLSDLEEYKESPTKSKYYFGHFLFENKKDGFGVIDGQQRLTTIQIFLSAVFKRLKMLRPLCEKEQEAFEDIIKRNSTYRFKTVEYDNQLFKDYVIDQSKQNKKGLETKSVKRIVEALDFFTQQLQDKDEEYLTKMLEIIQDSSCTTHHVIDEAEAIQMFIFQNNRGKKPSNLEIIKAQFMFNVHLHCDSKTKESLIKEIKERFEKIYKSISSIEENINEDDVLVYTLRVYFNSLWESNAIDKVNKLLSEKDPIPFIESFTLSLAESFEALTSFFVEDQRENIEIHSLVSFGDIGISIPFIIKAYKYNLPPSKINCLCSTLESLVIRHRLIGTRADIKSRLNDVYKEFTFEESSIQPIINKIKWMKEVTEWWAYWNNDKFKESIQGDVSSKTAKFLLWKYENHLESEGKSGYSPTRFDKIESPELEHIAPETENEGGGYGKYDEEFENQYLNCLGNYLLLSKSHNCSVGNKPFDDKRNSYTHSEQQREIQKMTDEENPTWTKEHIKNRKEKIVKFLTDTF